MKSYVLSLLIACMPTLCLGLESKDFISIATVDSNQELILTLTADKGYEIHPDGVELTNIKDKNIISKYALAPKIVRIHLDSQNLPSSIAIQYQGCSKTSCYAPSTATIPLAPPSSWIYLGLKLFGLGLITAFSPCILPIMPLLIYYISRKQQSKYTAIGSFLAGTLIAYGMIAYVFNKASQLLFHQLQTPYVLVFSSIFIIALGILAYPHNTSWQHRWESLTNPIINRIQSPLLGGILATLVLSPCATPSLVASLTLTASTPTYQAIPLMMLFALGLLTPMTVMGLTGIHISERFAHWHIPLQILISLVLLLLGLDLLIKSQLVSFVAAISLVSLIFISLLAHHSKLIKTFRAPVLSLLALCLIIIYQPSSIQQSSSITTLSEYHNTIQKPSNHIKVVFFTAQWCSLCQQLKKQAHFKNLSDSTNIQWIEVDLSNTIKQWQPFLIQHQLLGPPALMVISPSNKILLSFIGSVSESQSKKVLNLAANLNKT
jgi:thiol:disulfide interchange protein